MGKRKRTENIQKNYPSEELLIPAVALMIMLLLAWTWTIIVAKTGLSGAAYFFSVFHVILVVMVVLPYTLKSVIAIAVRKRAEQNQFRNAKCILNAGILISIIYSIITVSLLYIFSDSLLQSVLINQKSQLTLMILNTVILFYSIACTFMGYFEGLGGSFPLLLASITGHLVMTIATAIFTDLFMKQGEKAANVLRTQGTQYAYGAVGAAIGITAGIVIMCIAILVMYQFYSSYFRRLLKRDTSRRRTDTVDVVTRLIRQVLPIAGSYLMMLLYPVIDQTIFFRTMGSGQDAILMSYQWGAYDGLYGGVMFLPLLIALALASREREKISLAFRSGDYHEVRIKAHGMIRDNIIISLFFMVLLLVMADKVIVGFFMVESALAVRMIRCGCIALILLSLSVLLLILLPAINMSIAALITGICALAANVLTAFLTIKVLSLGVYGAMISVIVFGFVYVLLGIMFLGRAVRGRIDLRKTFYCPFLSAAITGIAMLLLGLLFELFLPPILNVLATLVISFVIYFIALAKLDVISAYSVSRFPFGELLLRFGKMIGIFP